MKSENSSLLQIISSVSLCLHSFLTAPITIKYHPKLIFWFSLSITFSAFYGILALQQGFSSEYVVQDDARQHVFWMRRFIDRNLFPNDLIADYFQSVAPLGYSAFYQLMALLGIDPIVLSKIIPLFLGLITTGYCFAVSMELFPVPLTGFIASLLLNQNLWMQDGLISGTAKAFIYPIMLAFFYYLLRQSLLGVGFAIAILGLFYPSLVLVCAVILILQLWRFPGKGVRGLRLSQKRWDYIFCFTSLGVAFLVLLPYALSSSEFSPVMTAAEAKTLPEFLDQGRSSFFVDDPWKFWLHGRSGIGLATALTPPLIYSGLLLPIILKYKSYFPLAQQVSNRIKLLPQILLASGVMFFASHAVLFKLHLPSRYTQHTLRMVIAIAAGIALTLILDAVWLAAIRRHQEEDRGQRTPQLIRQLLALGLTLLMGSILGLYPNLTLKHFPWTGYIVGGVPELYKFLQQQPKDILIASLTAEANNLPSFAQRSILVSREYAIPYHLGYYRQYEQRTVDLIKAQYSLDSSVVRDFIQKYGIDFWLLSENAFNPDSIVNDKWLIQHKSAATEAIAQLQTGKQPALVKSMSSCSMLETQGLVVLPASCILKNITK